MQEFPKCLYQGGDILAPYQVVFSAEEEADAAEKGFIPFGDAPAAEAPVARRKPGPKPKAAAE